ncbi:MAG: hypothetical protein VYA34_16200 [Myxococcota bacterium]|nr:hypothetical protein [Myxococcota bacterium]
MNKRRKIVRTLHLLCLFLMMGFMAGCLGGDKSTQDSCYEGWDCTNTDEQSEGEDFPEWGDSESTDVGTPSSDNNSQGSEESPTVDESGDSPPTQNHLGTGPDISFLAPETPYELYTTDFVVRVEITDEDGLDKDSLSLEVLTGGTCNTAADCGEGSRWLCSLRLCVVQQGLRAREDISDLYEATVAIQDIQSEYGYPQLAIIAKDILGGKSREVMPITVDRSFSVAIELESAVMVAGVSNNVQCSASGGHLGVEEIEVRLEFYPYGPELLTAEGRDPTTGKWSFSFQHEASRDYNARCVVVGTETRASLWESYHVNPGSVVALETDVGGAKTAIAGEDMLINCIAKDEFGNIILESEVIIVADSGDVVSKQVGTTQFLAYSENAGVINLKCEQNVSSGEAIVDPVGKDIQINAGRPYGVNTLFYGDTQTTISADDHDKSLIKFTCEVTDVYGNIICEKGGGSLCVETKLFVFDSWGEFSELPK